MPYIHNLSVENLSSLPYVLILVFMKGGIIPFWESRTEHGFITMYLYGSIYLFNGGSRQKTLGPFHFGVVVYKSAKCKQAISLLGCYKVVMRWWARAKSIPFDFGLISTQDLVLLKRIIAKNSFKTVEYWYNLVTFSFSLRS